MISRLTALAAAFSIFATGFIAFAASAQQPATPAITAKQIPVYQLERVVVVGKRLPANSR